MALIASLFLARRVVRPVRILREGVERIGTGDLGYRLDLKTGDEIEVLADEFNKMTTQLQESYATWSTRSKTEHANLLSPWSSRPQRVKSWALSQFAD